MSTIIVRDHPTGITKESLMAREEQVCDQFGVLLSRSYSIDEHESISRQHFQSSVVSFFADRQLTGSNATVVDVLGRLTIP